VDTMQIKQLVSAFNVLVHAIHVQAPASVQVVCKHLHNPSSLVKPAIQLAHPTIMATECSVLHAVQDVLFAQQLHAKLALKTI